MFPSVSMQFASFYDRAQSIEAHSDMEMTCNEDPCLDRLVCVSVCIYVQPLHAHNETTCFHYMKARLHERLHAFTYVTFKLSLSVILIHSNKYILSKSCKAFITQVVAVGASLRQTHL